MKIRWTQVGSTERGGGILDVPQVPHEGDWVSFPGAQGLHVRTVVWNLFGVNEDGDPTDEVAYLVIGPPRRDVVEPIPVRPSDEVVTLRLVWPT